MDLVGSSLGTAAKRGCSVSLVARHSSAHGNINNNTSNNNTNNSFQTAAYQAAARK
jgi:hypothetical protein